MLSKVKKKSKDVTHHPMLYLGKCKMYMVYNNTLKCTVSLLCYVAVMQRQ